MNILVTGASGYIGGRLTPRLIASGHHVVVLSRHPDWLSQRWPDVEVRYGDAFDAASLGEALAGIDVAYYLIHSMAEGEKGFEDRDRVAARNFGEAARKAGVKRIIYLGGLGDPSDKLSPHLSSRQETGDILRASGVPVTEFRAAIIIGSGSMSFELIRYLTERLPVMITPRWVSTRCQPISIRDVLEYLVECLDMPDTSGQVIEIGGPDVLTYAEMMHIYASVRGLRRWMIPVPLLTPRLSSYWIDLVTPIPAAYARPLIKGLSNEVIVRKPEVASQFRFRLMSYRDGVQRALEKLTAGEVETDWATSAPVQQAADQEAERPLVALSDTEGMLLERRRWSVDAPAETVFRVVSGIGGERGWPVAHWMWQLRGLMDRMVGGVGMRRGRRDPDRLRVGDPLDFWRVEAVEENRLVRLRAEMRLPGPAWLQFEVDPHEHESVLTQTAFFAPRGLWGVLYWYVLYPVHQWIFSRMVREIGRRAEALAVGTSGGLGESFAGD